MQWNHALDETKKDGLCQKLIKADLNGALIEVIRCENA
jgi:hypothetical protein